MKILALLLAASLSAHAAQTALRHFQRIFFDRPAGDITLFVPKLVEFQEHFSSRIRFSPNGTNPTAQAKNLALLQAYRISFFHNQSSTENGTIHAVRDSLNGPKDLICILGPGEDNHTYRNWHDYCVEVNFYHWEPTKTETSIPEIVESTVFTVSGSFSGDLTQAPVTLDGSEIQPLAASEHEMFIDSPVSPGLHDVVVHDRNGHKDLQSVPRTRRSR